MLNFPFPTFKLFTIVNSFLSWTYILFLICKQYDTVWYCKCYLLFWYLIKIGYYYYYYYYHYYFYYIKKEDTRYLKYLLHLFRRVAAFVELILFSSSVSLQIWYFDPLNVLVADWLFLCILTSKNCRLSIKILPKKNTKIAHSRLLNGMLDVSRQRAICKPSSVR